MVLLRLASLACGVTASSRRAVEESMGFTLTPWSHVNAQCELDDPGGMARVGRHPQWVNAARSVLHVFA